MNVKKISLVLVVLLALVASLGAISADDHADIKFANGLLSIEHSTFKIPTGFVENQNARLVDQHTTILNNVPVEESKAVFTQGNKNISVSYYEIDDGVTVHLDPVGNTVSKTIAGHQGLFEQQPDGSCAFMFSVPNGDANDLVQIVAPDEQTIATLITG